MSSYLEVLNLDLSNDTVSGKLRQQVLQTLPWSPSPTTNVSYVAANRLLIIADMETAREIESALPEKMLVYIAVPADKSGAIKTANGYRCAGLSISGYLGRFEVLIDQHKEIRDDSGLESNNLANIFNISSGLFDQVLSYGKDPLISAAVKPPGYHHVDHEPESLELAIANIPEMIGEFEKPRFFDYDPDICAHGRSGITGCTRCIDACPTDAIISLGETIRVDPHLCQGGGSCTSSCPTGAISYTYPRASEQIEFLRVMLRAMRKENGDRGVTLLIFDNEHGRQWVEAISNQIDGHIIPFVVEEIGSAGLDLIASALAYGANQVYLFVPDQVPFQVISALKHNLSIVNAVLEQTGCSSHRAEIIVDLDLLPNSTEPEQIESAAVFAAVGDKRNIIRTALSFFSEHGEDAPPAASLPAGSLFGQIHVEVDACTLCMGCVSVCPGNALQAGGDTPALKFIEANCVQCGICTRACPESAVTLEPRLHFDYNVVSKVRALKEEVPFPCVSCGKPFATKAMISRITEKLKDHWMFDNPDALDRLRMCEDCRIKDMFDKKDMIT
jgi:ferredoxin